MTNVSLAALLRSFENWADWHANSELSEVRTEELLGAIIPVESSNGHYYPFSATRDIFNRPRDSAATHTAAVIVAAKFVILNPIDGDIFKEAESVDELQAGIFPTCKKLYRMLGELPVVELRLRIKPINSRRSVTIRSVPISMPNWDRAVAIDHIESAQGYGFYETPEEFFKEFVKNGGLKINKPALICSRLTSIAGTTRFHSSDMGGMELPNVKDLEKGTSHDFEQSIFWSPQIDDVREVLYSYPGRIFKRPPITQVFLDKLGHSIERGFWPLPAPLPGKV